MRRDQLEHAIRAACSVSGDTELLIFGSQAILGSHPDPPEALTASIEVDVQALNFPEKTDAIDANLGELSRFHQTHGFYVHGVSIESALLPAGWEQRTIPVSDLRRTQGCTGHCPEGHDLAASKLVAFREKDRTFVVTLLAEGLIDGETLLERIADLPVDDARRDKLSTWVRRVVRDLAE
jgi:hypothetical protein